MMRSRIGGSPHHCGLRSRVIVWAVGVGPGGVGGVEKGWPPPPVGLARGGIGGGGGLGPQNGERPGGPLWLLPPPVVERPGGVVGGGGKGGAKKPPPLRVAVGEG